MRVLIFANGLTNVIVLLIFVVIAPLFIEQFKLLPAAWNLIADLLAKIGLISR
jgi:hypothetical protein